MNYRIPPAASHHLLKISQPWANLLVHTLSELTSLLSELRLADILLKCNGQFRYILIQCFPHYFTSASIQEKTWNSKQKRTSCCDDRYILSSAGPVLEPPPQGSMTVIFNLAQFLINRFSIFLLYTAPTLKYCSTFLWKMLLIFPSSFVDLKSCKHRKTLEL